MGKTKYKQRPHPDFSMQTLISSPDRHDKSLEPPAVQHKCIPPICPECRALLVRPITEAERTRYYGCALQGAHVPKSEGYLGSGQITHNQRHWRAAYRHRLSRMSRRINRDVLDHWNKHGRPPIDKNRAWAWKEPDG